MADLLPPVFCANPACPQVARFHQSPRFIGAFIGRGRCDRCGKWTVQMPRVTAEAFGDPAQERMSTGLPRSA